MQFQHPSIDFSHSAPVLKYNPVMLPSYSDDFGSKLLQPDFISQSDETVGAKAMRFQYETLPGTDEEEMRRLSTELYEAGSGLRFQTPPPILPDLFPDSNDPEMQRLANDMYEARSELSMLDRSNIPWGFPDKYQDNLNMSNISPTPCIPRSDSCPLPSFARSMKGGQGRLKVLECPIPQCTKTFTRKYGLTSHMDTHSDARPHSCGICTVSFKRVSDLKRHSRACEKRLVGRGSVY